MNITFHVPRDTVDRHIQAHLTRQHDGASTPVDYRIRPTSRAQADMLEEGRVAAEVLATATVEPTSWTKSVIAAIASIAAAALCAAVSGIITSAIEKKTGSCAE